MKPEHDEFQRSQEEKWRALYKEWEKERDKLCGELEPDPSDPIDQMRHFVLKHDLTPAQLQELLNTDWDAYKEAYARKREALWGFWDTMPTLCKGCFQIITFKDVVKPAHGPDYVAYCASCAREVEDSYRRVCAFCGEEFFILNPKTHQCALCTSCKERPELAKELTRVRGARQRAEEAGREATLTVAEWWATVEHFGGLCAYCQKQPFYSLNLFIPFRSGGGATWDNCVPACQSCSSRKRQKNPDELGPDERLERVRRYLESRKG